MTFHLLLVTLSGKPSSCLPDLKALLSPLELSHIEGTMRICNNGLYVGGGFEKDFVNCQLFLLLCAGALI